MPPARRLPAAAGVVLPVPPRRRAPGGHGLNPLERFIRVEGPYDFDETLRYVPFGPYDPTCRLGVGVLWKAARTPEGPLTLQLVRSASGVLARTWGEGGRWGLARVPALLGLADEPSTFAPPPGDPLATLARRGRSIRLPRSPWVLDGLTEYVLQQRVSFRDASRSQRRLVRTLGAAAPGPPGLVLPLAPSDWLAVPSHELRRAGIDGQRARALRSAARQSRSVAAAFEMPAGEARRALASVPGCGPWTVEITLGFVLGDADAVPVGDLHLPHEVSWALAAEPRGDDRRMLELLEPYRGHRFRVLRLLLAARRLHLGRASRL